jgi:hypothetical protein
MPIKSNAVAEPPKGPAVRAPRATLFDLVTLARARERDSTAITSTTAAFLLVALRRDVLLAPRTERRRIFEQVRAFRTVGEAALYVQAVIREVERSGGG